jgi:predicted TIM-barrel fold metal-dependent hydrolase
VRIDIHSHFQSVEFVKHLVGRSALPSAMREGGTYIVDCGAGLRVPSLPELIDVEAKLDAMDRLGVDVSVLTHGLPLGPDVLGAEADDWAMRINDDLARIVETYPDKFIGFGSLGLADPERTIAEVDRCVNELGFRGFQLFSNLASLDDRRVRPVLGHIARVGVPVHLHPTLPLHPGVSGASLMLAFAFPVDSGLNLVRLTDRGLFDEAPDLALIVSHAGGVLPYLMGRLDVYTKATQLTAGSPTLAHPFGEYLHGLYVDTVCYHAAALECCYATMGASRMVYGTDHPFAEPQQVAELIDALECSSDERELIYHGNIEALTRGTAVTKKSRGTSASVTTTD